ncbi:hypothetical protein ACH5RR_004072 [Cinchona calisaya]|uniref:DUF4408 domain-containing protein n=1 Tax=Cinchona calisaya TaxID=153742 RepID=A0ABD3AWZ7_9GENT
MNVAEPLLTTISSLFTPTILFCIMNLMIGTIFITSRLKSHKKPSDPVNSPPPNHLVRLPSFLDRVKSFNFSSSEQPDPFHSSTRNANPLEEREQKTEAEEGEVLLESHDDVRIMRSKSDTTASVAAKGGPAMRMKKSVSEKAVVVEDQEEEVNRLRPAKERLSGNETVTFREEDEAVDKKADDFINRFRQQLKLQRLDSILRYKEMLSRGVGVGS